MGRIERTQCDSSFCLVAFQFHYGGLVRFLATFTAASRRRAAPLLGADPLYELARRAPDELVLTPKRRITAYDVQRFLKVTITWKRRPGIYGRKDANAFVLCAPSGVVSNSRIMAARISIT